MLSFWLLAILAAGGVSILGTWAGLRRSRSRPVVSADEPQLLALGPGPEALTALQVGDVLLVGGEELWLVGAWVFQEAGVPVGTLFLSSDPEPKRKALWRSASLDSRAYLLEPLDPALLPASPVTLEVQGRPYQRLRRVPVLVQADGTVQSPQGQGFLWVEFEASDGSKLFALQSQGEQQFLWKGLDLQAESILRLAGGKATLVE